MKLENVPVLGVTPTFAGIVTGIVPTQVVLVCIHARSKMHYCYVPYFSELLCPGPQSYN